MTEMENIIFHNLDDYVCRPSKFFGRPDSRCGVDMVSSLVGVDTDTNAGISLPMCHLQFAALDENLVKFGWV